MKNSKFYKIKFDNHRDDRGSLVSLENNKQVPFKIRRVFCIFDTANNVVRGSHANLNSRFVFLCLSGSCKIKIYDGKISRVFTLNNPIEGLFLDKLIWKEMYDFSNDCVLLCISDNLYNPNEYIKDFEAFCKMARTLL